MINAKYLGVIAFLIMLLFLIEFTLSTTTLKNQLRSYYFGLYFLFGYCLERTILKRETHELD